ncbi:SpoIIE family protein phosphatase [Streptomyces sp. NPDC059637]|uniref:ATP-binding SpoIIE family protein phosphatase n=1 Tax=Streptomyces TaxID=1883 RepID=UPI00368A0B6E
MAPFAPESVLTAVGTGTFVWQKRSDTARLDAETARLLGLPPHPATLRTSAVRCRLHAEDYVELTSLTSLALAEDSVLEALLRVVDEAGTVLRVVCVRICSLEVPGPLRIVGTVQEVRDEDLRAAGGLRGAETAPGTDPAATDRRRSREAFLLDAGRALAEAADTEQVLQVAAGLSMPGFSPDGLAVFGVDAGRLSVVGHHGQLDDDVLPFLDMPLDTDYPAAVAVRTGRAVYLPTPEAYRHRFPAIWPLVEPFGRSSWAFLPLVAGGRTVGAWMAGFSEPVDFTPDRRSVLTTVARMLAQALERARVHESERALADGLQRTMLPGRMPRIPGVTMAARYVPAGDGLQVGGDWYDLIPLPHGRFALVIGDVQGHDVRAASLMSQLRIALRAYASEGHPPDAVLSRASRFFSDLNAADPAGWRFATCLYLELHPARGTIAVARAGHLEPILRLSDGTAVPRRTAGGLPLGVDAETDYPISRMRLDPGQTLVLYTDGLVEAGGHNIDSGWRRLRKVIGEVPGDDLETLADELIAAVHGPASRRDSGPLANRREDDTALVLLRRETTGRRYLPPVRRTVLTVAQDEPERVSAAREEVRAVLHDWSVPDHVDAAELLTSELLSNVLVHTDCEASLVAEVTGARGRRRLRVEVRDASDELPHRRHPGELASSGRGLMLLDMLADRSGVEPRGEGKCIWFELSEDGGGSRDDGDDGGGEGGGDRGSGARSPGMRASRSGFN